MLAGFYPIFARSRVSSRCFNVEKASTTIDSNGLARASTHHSEESRLVIMKTLESRLDRIYAANDTISCHDAFRYFARWSERGKEGSQQLIKFIKTIMKHLAEIWGKKSTFTCQFGETQTCYAPRTAPITTRFTTLIYARADTFFNNFFHSRLEQQVCDWIVGWTHIIAQIHRKKILNTNNLRSMMELSVSTLFDCNGKKSERDFFMLVDFTFCWIAWWIMIRFTFMSKK